MSIEIERELRDGYERLAECETGWSDERETSALDRHP
jgi:hypothetical protein